MEIALFLFVAHLMLNCMKCSSRREKRVGSRLRYVQRSYGGLEPFKFFSSSRPAVGALE